MQLLSTLRTSSDSVSSHEYNRIIVTNKSLSNKLRHIYSSNERTCYTKPFFLFTPDKEDTLQFGQFLRSEIKDIVDNHSMIEMMTELNKMAKNDPRNFDQDTSVAQMIKSTWSFAFALKSLQRKECANLNKLDCLKKIKSNIRTSMMTELESLNATIEHTNLKSLEKFNLQFDKDHLLVTNRYSIQAVTSNCKVIEIGFYQHLSGLVLENDFISKLQHVADQSKSTFERPNMLNLRKENLFAQDKDEIRSHSRPTKTRQLFNSTIDSALKSNSNLIPNMAFSNQELKSFSETSSNRLSQKIDQSDQEKSSRNISEKTEKWIGSFASWLGKAWSYTIISLSTIGVILTVYSFTYILVKTYGAAFKKSNQVLATFSYIISIIAVYIAASL